VKDVLAELYETSPHAVVPIAVDQSPYHCGRFADWVAGAAHNKDREIVWNTAVVFGCPELQRKDLHRFVTLNSHVRGRSAMREVSL
jgi:hypothetical protein